MLKTSRLVIILDFKHDLVDLVSLNCWCLTNYVKELDNYWFLKASYFYLKVLKTQVYYKYVLNHGVANDLKNLLKA